MAIVNWGILSTAKIAQKELIPAFLRSTNAKVTAIATGSGIERAQQVAQKFSIEKAYDNNNALLEDSSIDAVYIPLPNHLHKKWVIEAAKKRKHILCEKPAALTANEVIEMKEACEQNGVIFMEGFMYQFHPQHERVRQIIDSGEIGEISYMRASFSFLLANKENTIKMNDQGGGCIYDIGCYPIHSIRNILREEPTHIQTQAKYDETYKVDTDVYTYMEFASGRRAVFDASFNQMRRSEYEVVGTEGRVIVPRAYRPDWNGGDGLVIVEKSGISRTETLNADQYRNQIEVISAAILDGKIKSELSFDNTFANMHVIDACFKSMKSGKLVQL
ncbi:Gfo/Idh/MocA family protein [Halalkalibacter krulwichiae]|uniref:1,5-anhydro-D-fructose reductase n=1 Tax=Halalkalibacter krulwichiae TaxID=199441 RepID=A0A1X9MKQ4_9BACI|nr:Gfo/Idh/MocA family oxidoreductase [Halalkalibacter krulwichiae]ARK31242.1 1,5-anhydro-D-fructose reductase [Halalkalibacter krulwichiae]